MKRIYLMHEENFEKGQALLFVILAMTVALALGVSVSTRTLSSLSRSTRTDTAERVRAIAEGGAERVLVLPSTVLSGGIASEEDCETTAKGALTDDGFCVFNIGSDGRALVKVTDFSTNAGSMYRFNVEGGSVTEVKVDGMEDIKICWDGDNDLYYSFYGESSILGKEAFRTSTEITGGIGGYDNTSYQSAAGCNFDYCIGGCAGSVEVPSGAYGLRIKALHGDLTVSVGAEASTLPLQGHKIESWGELLKDGQVQTKKKVTVYKSLPYLPAIFDFGVYTNDGWSL